MDSAGDGDADVSIDDVFGLLIDTSTALEVEILTVRFFLPIHFLSVYIYIVHLERRQRDDCCEQAPAE